jgi:replicative DNA helicase
MYNADPTSHGKALLKIGKNRAGPTGEVELTFIREYTKFENYAAEDEEAPG